ncbi:Histone acetyltransferase complex subunit [Pleurotus ostreatus]|uniref:Chromatin modification-related protein n=2 Tax=Pleurotus ostreatus TaxID=5322 RepID=A0A067NZP3_PLEO1|nr:Histone acetyltransferase complex subunit [Pleurotus ostreatus]KAF7432776.1 Histone acetyltransferase complex subunit [Pleurotus ostreatus]KDQ29627.1 hypothetical protein PLEOSDRAFT_50530 [Pleurotus ostreatus PC15]
MSVSVQNMEEAAAIATEYISSIDNLPNEVHHILQEIRHKDMRYQEIQQELSRDQARFIRHSLRHPSPSANTPGSVSATSPTVDSPVGQTPTGTNGSSRLLIPSKVEDAYKELNQLADEKIALSQRIIEVLARSRARLDFDLAKVRALQGESEIPNTRSYQPYSGASTPLPIVDSITLSAPPSLGENLRNSLLAPDVLPLSPAATAAAMGSVPKKRRITVTNSIKLPSPIPQASSVGASSASSRSRLSRQAHIPRPPDEDVLELDIDPDAEGDEDLEADDAEDTTIYCFCQKTGAGEMMIGCDNPSCSYQWFHISCVGVKQPLPDKWYCPECKSKGAGAPGRKGRKKTS